MKNRKRKRTAIEIGFSWSEPNRDTPARVRVQGGCLGVGLPHTYRILPYRPAVEPPSIAREVPVMKRASYDAR